MPTTSRTGTHTPAHQVCPSTLVDARVRSLSTQRRRNNPRSWYIPCNRRSSPQAQSSTAVRSHTLRLALANEHRAAAAGTRHEHDRRFEVENLTCVRVPLQLPVPVCVGVVLYRRLGMRTRPLRVQMRIPMRMGTLVLLLLCLHLLHWLLLPSLDLLTATPNSNSGPQVFYTNQELVTDFRKGPELTVHCIPMVHSAPNWPQSNIKRAMGEPATIGHQSQW